MSQKLNEKFNKLPVSRKPKVEIYHQPEIRDDGTVHYSGVTLARLRDPKTNEIIAFGIGRTNKNLDSPNKKIGTEVALGRALKQFFSNE